MSEDEDEDNPEDRNPGTCKPAYDCSMDCNNSQPIPERLWDRRIVPENEFYDSDEGETDERGTQRQSMHSQSYASEAVGEQMNGTTSHTNEASRVILTEDEEMELDS